MFRNARGLMFGSTLLLALMVLATSNPQAQAFVDKEVADAQKQILELTKLVEADKPIGDKAAEFKKKNVELLSVMHVHKPKTRDGLGLELEFINLGKRAPAGAALAKRKAELLKLANINLVVGEITTHYAPTTVRNGKGPKDWKAYNDDMIKATKELKKAINDAKAADIKKAATNINNACNECHTAFRD